MFNRKQIRKIAEQVRRLGYNADEMFINRDGKVWVRQPEDADGAVYIFNANSIFNR